MTEDRFNVEVQRCYMSLLSDMPISTTTNLLLVQWRSALIVYAMYSLKMKIDTTFQGVEITGDFESLMIRTVQLS